MATYRVGNHQPQNVYRDDAYIGVMFTAEDAALIVETMNGQRPAICLTWIGETAQMCQLPHGHGGACGSGSSTPTCLGRDMDCGRTLPCPDHGPPPVEHRAETPGGDGLGYGKCTGCGQLWPCMASRSERT